LLLMVYSTRGELIRKLYWFHCKWVLIIPRKWADRLVKYCRF
jgi:hypothetical protein